MMAQPTVRDDPPGAAQPGSILLVGRNSFIARHVASHLPAPLVRTAGYEEIGGPGLLDGVRCVINFTRHPLIARSDYDVASMDTDLRLCAQISGREIAYVMLSTRKVYAPSDRPLGEAAPLAPADAYGRHKLHAENTLRARLGERLTVLRLGNVFGYERMPGRRTFLSLLLDRLGREGQIRYDMSPFVVRDFLPVERAAHLLARIALTPPGGVFNLGSGIPLPTGRIALWILEAYGAGELVIESPREHDSFVLDVTKIAAAYAEPCTASDLRDACFALGRRLADEQALPV